MVLVLGIAVAGTAGEEDDLLLGIGFHGVVVLELLEAHVAELHLHGLAGMDLQGDDAVLAGHRVFIDQFAHQVAVDLLDDAVSAGGDVVLVPVAVLDELGQFGRVAEALDLALAVLADHHLLAAAGQAAAIILAVASARVVVVGIHVGLIAADLPFLGTFPTADLHAGVGKARVGHAELDLQLEVGRLAAPPDEKRVVGARDFPWSSGR